jgi:hypothetical protein
MGCGYETARAKSPQGICKVITAKANINNGDQIHKRLLTIQALPDSRNYYPHIKAEAENLGIDKN